MCLIGYCLAYFVFSYCGNFNDSFGYQVKQREDDAQFNKMMLRFREDKIKRLESTLEGTLSSDSYQSDENQTLKEELQLLRARLDKNPELTRFAIENIRLMDQLQR